MRVLLVATNQADRFMDRMVVRPVPIGLAYIAAAVDENRHELKVLDLMFSDDGAGDVEGAVREFEPDLVGLSIRNLDNQSYFNPVSNLPGVRDIVGRIRSVSDATILCGGPAFGILPAECLEYVGADLGIAGDAGEAFATLLDRLESGSNYADIPGMVYRRDGEVTVSEGRFTSYFHNAPRLDLLDMQRYNGSGFGVGVVTKLAQAYYPTSGNGGDNGEASGGTGVSFGGFDGSDWRIRDPGEVVDEVRALNEDYGINKIFFIDSGFNIPPEHAKSICRAVIASGVSIRWNSYVRPGYGDDELLRLMKESGCSLALLAESGRGGGDLAERLDRLGVMGHMMHEAGLPFSLNMSFGEPGETEDSVERKLSLMKQVEPSFVAVRAGVRALPGTPVAAAAVDEGMICSESDLIEPVFYMDEAVRDWLPDRLRAEAAERPRWNLS